MLNRDTLDSNLFFLLLFCITLGWIGLIASKGYGDPYLASTRMQQFYSNSQFYAKIQNQPVGLYLPLKIINLIYTLNPRVSRENFQFVLSSQKNKESPEKELNYIIYGSRDVI